MAPIPRVHNDEPLKEPDEMVVPEGPSREASAIISRNEEQVFRMKKLAAIFSCLDLDENGMVGLEELGVCLRRLGVTGPTFRRFMAKADESGNGSVGRDEFFNLCEDPEFMDMVDRMEHLMANERSSLVPRYQFMLRQASVYRVTWDIVGAGLLALVAIIVPFSLAFMDEVSPGSLVDVFNHVVETFFIFELALNFRTGYYTKDGFEILDWRQVGTHYLRSWFFLDLLSAVPYERIVPEDSDSSFDGSARLAKTAKMRRVFRVLKMSRLIKLLLNSSIADQVNDFAAAVGCEKYVSFLFMFVATAVLCHWLGCFMAFSGNGFLEHYQDLGESTLRRYVASLYWAMTTMTTVGYGDITPGSDWERLYAMLAMVIGGIFYGFVLGHITSIITTRDLKDRVYHERMAEVQAWLDFHQFPRQMRLRVRRYFTKYLSKKAAPDEVSIINDLSPELRADLSEFMVSREVRANIIFENLAPGVLSRLVKIIQRISADVHEKIVMYGDVGHSMFVIITGKVFIQHCVGGRLDQPEYALESCDSFGEELLFGDEITYKYNAIAAARTNLQSIPSVQFAMEFSRFPDIFNTMRRNYHLKMGIEDNKTDYSKSRSLQSAFFEGLLGRRHSKGDAKSADLRRGASKVTAWLPRSTLE